MSNKFLLLPFFGLLLPVAVYLYTTQLANVATVSIEQIGDVITSEATAPVEKANSVLFLGDVLLARHVEYLMNINGLDYPYINTKKIFLDSSLIFANFESAILEKHITTPFYTTTFATSELFLPSLKQSGVTHVTLANNHTYDYGASAFEYTVGALLKAGITPFGNPENVSDTSITTVMVNNRTVGIIGINQVSGTPAWEEVIVQLEKLIESTEYQIAYIHWGTEYNLKHNTTQEQFAHQLLDAGVDAIIGHHPHVTQDIEIYNNKPIFYSLGNFIFDQYFSVDVKQGLTVRLDLSTSSAQFSLTPVTSEGSKAQPTVMNEADRLLFLANLARRSTPEFSEHIKSGRVIFDF